MIHFNPYSVFAVNAMSSANISINIYSFPWVNRSALSPLLRTLRYIHVRIYCSACSKNMPNRSGEHGHPYFTPLLIIMRRPFVPCTLAVRPSYIRCRSRINSFSSGSIYCRSFHNKFLLTLSYAFSISTKSV